MNEMKLGGKTFQYEKVMPEQFKKGACAFRVKDADGDENWWVVVPPTMKEQLDGMPIDCPNDGHIAAFCMSEQDALMLASSVCIAANITGLQGTKDALKKIQSDLTQKLSKGLGFDIDKLEAEVKRLKAEGKTADEIKDILKPRMDEFRRPVKDTSKEEW